MIWHLYLKYLQSRFNQWKNQLQELKSRGERIEFIIGTKLTRRILRKYFKKYKEGTLAARIDWYGKVKGVSGNKRIMLNTTRRIFDGIRRYTTNMRIAKNFLRKAMTNADLRSKKSFFNVWSRQHIHDRNNDNNNNQNKLVEMVKNANETKGSLQNQNHELEEEVKIL